ncbi:unnamed protein product, partial [Hapterophycus canaliculatus]
QQWQRCRQGRSALLQPLQTGRPPSHKLYKYASSQTRRLSCRRGGGPEGGSRGQDERGTGGVRVRS